jgi:hypothetical protein
MLTTFATPAAAAVPDQRAPEAATQERADAKAARAWPVDCSLRATGIRSGTFMTASGTVDCDYSATELYVDVRFQRSRWWGWEYVTPSDPAWGSGRYLSVVTSYSCQGTGTHNFRARAYSYIIRGGNLYNATQYYNFGTVSC